MCIDPCAMSVIVYLMTYLGDHARQSRYDSLPRAGREEPAPSRERFAPALPDKPSIAVLPFTNMSGDPDQEFFGDGIAEDILTDLAKLPWLFVIARNSSFIFRGKSVDIRAASRDLGVR